MPAAVAAATAATGAAAVELAFPYHALGGEPVSLNLRLARLHADCAYGEVRSQLFSQPSCSD